MEQERLTPEQIAEKFPQRHWRLLHRACIDLDEAGKPDLARQLWDATACFFPEMEMGHDWQLASEVVDEPEPISKWKKVNKRRVLKSREAQGYWLDQRHAPLKLPPLDDLGGLLQEEVEKLQGAVPFKAALYDSFDEGRLVYVLPRVVWVGQNNPGALSGPCPISLKRIRFPDGLHQGQNQGDAPVGLISFLIKTNDHFRKRPVEPLVFVVPGGGGMNLFYHAMVHALPSLQLYKEMGLDCPLAFPRFPVERQPMILELMHEIMDWLEIPRERVVPWESIEDTSYFTGIFPSQSKVCAALGDFYARFKRSYLGQIGQAGDKGGVVEKLGSRKIFISRKNAGRRAVENLQEIEELMEEQGYDVFYFEDLSLKEQMQVIDQSSVIAALYGAGLTNLLYARTGAKVLEIFNHDFNPMLGIPYCRIARAGGLAYHAFACEKGIEGERVFFHADIERLSQVLGSLT